MFDNFEFKKSFGQNFICDDNIIRKIVLGASIDKDTLVIEIGPGAGSLSKMIVPNSKYSILYEIDTRLEGRLNNILSDYDNYEIIFNDFLNEDVKSKIKNYDYKKLYVVANLPYYITTPIITKFISDDILPDRIVIMVQKEVADRLSATVGSKDYGSLTVLLNYYYDIKKLFDVSRNCFIPKPNVDSAVVCMDIKKNRLEVKDIDLFKRVVRDSFQFKRKNLRNNLKRYDLDKIENVLKSHNLDLSVRAESISLDIFVEIVNELI
jgi:16S rRNA (adenine1518-N6/adenine1519-N6)-dimethyltransferase